jgi:hypothetical protein
MRSDNFFALFGKFVLILVLLGGLAYGAYYFGTKNTQKQPVETSSQNPSSNQKSVIPFKAELTAVSKPSPVADEASILKITIKNALVAKHGNEANSLNITVSKINGDYASGMASSQGGGGLWFAAKVKGTWILVTDGNGITPCSDLIPYPQFPISMIPQCFDNNTQQLIKR